MSTVIQQSYINCPHCGSYYPAGNHHICNPHSYFVPTAPASLTEDDIRRIFREELRNALRELAGSPQERREG